MNKNINLLLHTLFEDSMFNDDIFNDDSTEQDASITNGIIGFDKKTYDSVINASVPHLRNHIPYTVFDTFPNAIYKFTDKTEKGRNAHFRKIINRYFGVYGRLLLGSYKSFNLNWIDTSNITDFSYLFTDANVIYNVDVDISAWDTSNVTSMEYMFHGCNLIPDISRWNIENVTTMYEMFSSCKFSDKQLLIDISKWNTKSLHNINAMFKDSNKIIMNLSLIKLPSVTEISSIFTRNENVDITLIDNLDTSNCRSLEYIFMDATIVNDGKLNWDVSNVIDMSCMFLHAKIKGDMDISKWNTQSLEITSNMFDKCNFNGDIDNWNVENLKYADNMFKYSGFRGDLTNWNITHGSAFTKNQYLYNKVGYKTAEKDELTIEEVLDLMAEIGMEKNRKGYNSQVIIPREQFKGIKFKIIKDNNQPEENTDNENEVE